MLPFLKYLPVACNVSRNRLKNEGEQRRDYNIFFLQHNISNYLKKKVHKDYSNRSVLGNINPHKQELQLAYIKHNEFEKARIMQTVVQRVLCYSFHVNSVKLMRPKKY
jgi:hypothetical protein